MIKKLKVVNHTHWDREWYESFETFRGKLIEGIKLINKSLDSGEFKFFMLDGQTIVIEDLKEILEKEEIDKLENYIKSGRVDIGPWYVLPDEFLVSGESIIRNLKIGIEISKTYGKNKFVGYLPDTFGHIGQLPQIFKGLNIEWALLFRGVNSKKSEVIFEGSDGTKIKSIVLPLWEGYYNYFLTYGDYEDRLKSYLDKIEKYTEGGEVLLLNGADHLIPYEKLDKRLKNLEKSLKISIEQTSLIEYVDEIKDENIKDIIKGEQRDERKAYILTNVASSRTYLKVQNQEIEDTLTSVAEPIELVKSLATKEYKHNYLEHIWRYLLKNHPHDSICGCSIDKVHKEMEIRNVKLKDMISSVEHYAAKALIEKEPVNNTKIFLFNPHPYELEEIIETTLVLPLDIQDFIIKDSNGKEISMQIISKEKKEIFLADVDLEPNWYEVNQFKIAFKAEFKGLGFKEYDIISGISVKNNGLYLEQVIENEFIKLWVNAEGYLNILNKEKNITYENINMFVSTLDAGDEYSYSPPIKDIVSKTKLKAIENIISTEDFKELRLRYCLEQPEGLNSNRTGASLNKVTTDITTVVKLLGSSKTIEFESTINNKAKDQRIRVVFPLNKKVGRYFTDISFDRVERVPLKNINYDAQKQKEVKVNSYPTDSYVYVENSFGIIHKGLQEVEVTSYGANKDAVYLTVMRSVGWLSRDDFRTRGGGAGPKVQTPDAQCLRKFTFNYALSFEEEIAFESKKIRVKPIAFQGNSIVKQMEELLYIDNKNIILSAFYRNNKNDILLRLYNSTDIMQKFHISSIWKNIYETNLFDEEIGKIEDEIYMQPKKILTLKLK